MHIGDSARPGRGRVRHLVGEDHIEMRVGESAATAVDSFGHGHALVPATMSDHVAVIPSNVSAPQMSRPRARPA